MHPDERHRRRARRIDVNLALAARRARGLARAHVVSLGLRLLPLNVAYRLARWHGRRTYRRMKPATRRRATEMARRLETSPAVVDHYLERYFELVASEKLEAHMYQRFGRQEIDRVIEIQGLEHLRTALAHGNGAILYSGHVAGHFTLFAALSIHGFPLTMLGFPGTRAMGGSASQRVLRTPARSRVPPYATRRLRNRDEGRQRPAPQPRPDDGDRPDDDGLEGGDGLPRVARMVPAWAGADRQGEWGSAAAVLDSQDQEGWIPQVAAIGEPLYVHDVDDAVRGASLPSWSGRFATTRRVGCRGSSLGDSSGTSEWYISSEPTGETSPIIAAILDRDAHSATSWKRCPGLRPCDPRDDPATTPEEDVQRGRS